MKKLILIILAIAFMLSLCAGCNTVKRIDDDFDDDIGPIVIGGTSGDNTGDKPRGDSPAEWPTDLPPYPDGEITRFELGEYDDYSIIISNTSKETLVEYAGMMTNAGWERRGDDDDDSAFIRFSFDKDNYSTALILLSDGTTLSIGFYRVLDQEELENVWPVDYLPKGFPEYPDGDISRIRVDESGKIIIDISDSSQETFDKYAAALKDAGWELEEYSVETMDLWYIDKDEKFGSISFYKPTGKVDITLY